ncbi:H/ACA ribonucleoprotein complex subunit 1-like [Durio zibethinus]|uniref:H/ACA ribonucleoprotein complex subunit 1-like n=1 Tax=Durio zibethinus TaxID=66656 RepID=A0A6P5ZMQ0_DURZI|nr:H/ACA ribonucleoprotein complex subunit 1-like [Durio zibethinus]
MGFKKFGMFFLLLSVQLHPLLAVLPQTSLPNPLMTIVKSGDKQNIIAVNKRGVGGGGHGGGHVGGGGRGGRGGARGRGNGGGKKSPYVQGGIVVPLYAAGATNHPRISHSRGSNGGTLNYVSLHYLILALFATFFLV